MVEGNRAPFYGLVVLVAVFLLKDLFIPNEYQSEETSPEAKEIPNIQMNRFAGPSVKFVFW